MTQYFCGAGGADVNSGLSWALRKLTLNGCEDIPLVAGDTVMCAPGVYRELLTIDVSGTAGNPITYIGDVSGASTDGVGGAVRITGSNDDLAATRANCITATARDYRTFRGFQCDTTTGNIINLLTTSGNWIIEDFLVLGHTANTGCIVAASGANITLRRGVILGGRGVNIQFSNATVIDNAGHVLENLVLVGTTQQHVNIARIGGIAIRNCLVFGAQSVGIRVQTALTVGQVVTVNNCVFTCCATGVSATTAAELVEDYNCFWGNTADRTTTAVGTHSVAAPPLFVAPLLKVGTMPDWQPFALGQWSTVKTIADSANATDDVYGLTRPVGAAARSWGPLQYGDSVPVVLPPGAEQTIYTGTAQSEPRILAGTAT